MTKVALLGILLAASSCSKSDPDAPPAKPANGVPIAFVTKGVRPGDNLSGSVTVKAYNFADRPLTKYQVSLRYYDDDNAVLKDDVANVAGPRFTCAPKTWCVMTIDNIDVPFRAERADVTATTAQ